jgi:biotin carboxyl carrier protein
MYKIKVNGRLDYEVESKSNTVTMNGEEFVADMVKLNADNYHVLHENRSYSVEVVELNETEKTASIKVNNNIYQMKAKDQFDALLEQLGLSNLTNNKISDVKAPMPGLVLKVLVNEGDEVKKGDSLFVLEAMKMENIIKAPADATVKTIKIKPTDKVEKGQLLILFK